MEKEFSEEKKTKAIIRYLDARGYLNIKDYSDKGFKRFTIAAFDPNEKCVVLICPMYSYEDSPTRDDFESDCIKVLAEYDFGYDIYAVRGDVITLHVVGESRALLKHHINWSQRSMDVSD